MSKPDIKIYSSPNCTYCEQAKALLKMKNLEFKEYVIETSDERMQLKVKFPNARTFPLVLINNVHIGGYTNLSQWIKDEKF